MQPRMASFIIQSKASMPNLCPVGHMPSLFGPCLPLNLTCLVKARMHVKILTVIHQSMLEKQSEPVSEVSGLPLAQLIYSLGQTWESVVTQKIRIPLCPSDFMIVTEFFVHLVWLAICLYLHKKTLFGFLEYYRVLFCGLPILFIWAFCLYLHRKPLFSYLD